MQHYYVNIHAQANGNHEVHVPRCAHFPEPDSRVYLGAFANCRDALNQARSQYEDSTGCAWCCDEGNTGN